MANILIVDDEEMERLFVRTILGGAGHQLYYAADGESALKTYRNNPIDLVVTDLKMPKLNGLLLIKELKEIEPNLPILAVSGASADQLLIAEDYGAGDTLYKPIDPPALLRAVDKALQAAKQSSLGRWTRGS